MDRIAKETARRITHMYAAMRQQAADAVERQIAAIHTAHPQIAALDRALAQAGAQLVLHTVQPHTHAAPHPQRQLRDLAQERQEVVQRLGLDPAYDRPLSHCAQCGDTGYTAPGVSCDCRRDWERRFLAEASGLGSLVDCTFARQDDRLFEDRVQAERDRADVSPREQARGVRAVSRQFATAVGSGNSAQARDLLLVGKPGTGKTYMAASIGNEVIAHGRSVRYLPAPLMFEQLSVHRALSASFRPDPDRLEAAAYDRDVILGCQLLILDDLGTETVQAHTLPEFLHVLDTRHGAGLRTVFATNVDLQALRQHYDERLWSRLLGRCTVLRLIGGDLRLAAAQRAARNRRRGRTAAAAPDRED